MKITRVSRLTGKTHEWNIDGVTPEKLGWWMDGALIQDAMPGLTPEEREFIMTGITPDEWNEAFGS